MSVGRFLGDGLLAIGDGRFLGDGLLAIGDWRLLGDGRLAIGDWRWVIGERREERFFFFTGAKRTGGLGGRTDLILPHA